jgi:general secretion pathway protein K
VSNLIKQRGAAIIVALFVTSLVAIAAIAMIERLRLNTRSTELIIHNIQNNNIAQGSIAWAMEQLHNDLQQPRPNQVVDRTPLRSPLNREENAIIATTIFDAQGRFNLNNLNSPSAQEDFVRLIRVAHPKTDILTARAITSATQNWLAGGANNALDDYYLKSNPPYRAPHRPMVSVSEFRLIKGVTADLFAAMAPFITVLPEATPININNAAPPVIMCLSPTMTLAAAKAVAARAKQAPFTSTQEFLQFDVVKNNPIPENKITVLSNYFLVKSRVTVSQQDTLLYTLLQRTVKNNQPTEVVLWQSKGTL